MFSFKRVVQIFTKTMPSELEVLKDKLDSIEKTMALKILNECTGTEPILTLGLGLSATNATLHRLMQVANNGRSMALQESRYVTIRDFFTEGDYIDMDGLLLMSFSRTATTYLTKTYRGPDYEKDHYYFKLIEDICDRLLYLYNSDLQ